VNALLLLRGVLTRSLYRPGAQIRRTGLRVCAGAAVMGIALWALLPGASAWLTMSALERALWLGGAVAGGGGLYLMLLVVMGERPKALLHRV
jgi:peptidoglycan biosynthesis protein MviN/MurJ (putative lipid II flippase)